jgi:hypothetical protein
LGDGVYGAKVQQEERKELARNRKGKVVGRQK